MTKDKDDSIQRKYDDCMTGYQDKDKKRVQEYLLEQAQKAQARYNALGNETIYEDACLDRFGIAQLTRVRRDLLIEEALAICGSPFCRVSRIQWNDTQWQYLAQFTKGVK